MSRAVEAPPLQLAPMTERDGQAICTWRYPEPYHLFKWPDWDDMVREEKEFADPELRRLQYLAVRNAADDSLVGYVQLFPMERTIRLGMGLRPDCCGRGWGAHLTRLVVQEASRRQPEAEIDLEVEQWNRRAIRAYEKAGFVVTDQYERRASHEIVRVNCMVWQGMA